MKIIVCTLLLGAAFAVSADPLTYTWHEPADGVFVGVRDDSPRIPVMGTTTFVVGDTGVIVFDGGGLPLMAERAIEKIRSVTKLPVTHVAISHWHQDHMWGIQAFVDAYPDVEVVAHRNTRDELIARNPGAEARVHAGTGEVRASLSERLAGDDPMSARERQRLSQFIEDGELLDREYARIRSVTPTLTFEDSLNLPSGERTVQLLHLGRGNTAGDIVLWLPDERIVATGDLVVRPTPYGFGSYPAHWGETLRRVQALDYALLIPGHGDFQRDAGYVDLLIETMDLVTEQMTALVAEGADQETATAQLDFASVEPRFTDGDAFLAERFAAWFKRPIARAAYLQAIGESPEIPVTP